jgi:hypothetical protein
MKMRLNAAQTIALSEMLNDDTIEWADLVQEDDGTVLMTETCRRDKPFTWAIDCDGRTEARTNVPGGTWTYTGAYSLDCKTGVMVGQKIAGGRRTV